MSTRISMHRSRLFPALHTLVASGALVAAPACVAEDAPPDIAAFDDLDLTPISPAGDQWNDCSTWDCNKNHPELTGFPVPELHEGGEPNEQEFEIVSFMKGGVAYQLDVTAGEIRGLDAMGNELLSDAELIGSIITVTNGTRTWEIGIAAYTDELEYWDEEGSVWAFYLVYRQVDAIDENWKNVCNQPASVLADPVWPDTYDDFATYAILIDDERYDRENIKVRQDGVDAEGWFNIACAGTALAKMVLLHADPNESGVHATTKAQRTATLKMLTADYFGTGRPFTQPGQDLWWSSNWFPLLPGQNISNPEAIWTEHGARCLSTPRLHGHPRVDVYAEITAYLKDNSDVEAIPSCGEVPPGAQPGDVWYTFNTFPQPIIPRGGR